MPLTGSCFDSIKNPGSSPCTTLLEMTSKIWFQSLKQSDGITYNEINLAAPINKALFDGLMNNKDPFIRIFPTSYLDKYEKNSADAITEENDYNVKYFVRNGVVSVKYEMWGSKASSAVYRHIETLRRFQDLGIYLIDSKGNIGYSRNNTGKTRPIRIVPGSLSIVEGSQSSSSVQNKLIVSFDIHNSENYGKLGVVPASQIATDVNIFDYEGMIDIYPKFSSITQTGCTLELYSMEGAEANPSRLAGLVIGDFVSTQTGATLRAYRENNTPADVTLTSVTEGSGSNKGVYAVVYPSQAIGSILRWEFVKAGYDSAPVRSVTMTI